MGIWATLADQLEAELAPPVPTYRWACDLPTCDGQPHNGWQYKHARTKQRMPEGDWFVWLLLCGRGAGKTRTGSEVFLDMVLDHPQDVDGIPTEWLIAGPTYDDTIKVLFEGVSSLSHALKRRSIDYRWNKNEKLLTLSTGQRIIMQYAERNEDLGRGGNWAGVWLDELGTYQKIRKAWDEAVLFSIRAQLPGGWRPRIVITTTPKTSAKEAFDLLWQIVTDDKPTTVVTRGTTWENAANIPTAQLEVWRDMFGPGTRSRRQELDAELLRDIEGALWRADMIDPHRVDTAPDEIVRRVVAIDPAYSASEQADLTGIVVCAKAMQISEETGKPQAHIFIEQDLSGRMTFDEWTKLAVKTAHEIDARIVIEIDRANGLEVRELRRAAERLQIPCPGIDTVRSMNIGNKATRAAPVAAAYENGTVHHVGLLAELETQMTTWVPEQTKKSPDRMDALVHGVRFLTNAGAPRAFKARSLD